MPVRISNEVDGFQRRVYHQCFSEFDYYNYRAITKGSGVRNEPFTGED